VCSNHAGRASDFNALGCCTESHEWSELAYSSQPYGGQFRTPCTRADATSADCPTRPMQPDHRTSSAVRRHGCVQQWTGRFGKTNLGRARRSDGPIQKVVRRASALECPRRGLKRGVLLALSLVVINDVPPVVGSISMMKPLAKSLCPEVRLGIRANRREEPPSFAPRRSETVQGRV
jgi:hypothetical protein